MNDSFFGRLTDLFTNPGRLMENVGANPRWWQPGLVVFLVMIVFSWFTLPISAPEQAELMRDSQAHGDDSPKMSPTSSTKRPATSPRTKD